MIEASSLMCIVRKWVLTTPLVHDWNCDQMERGKKKGFAAKWTKMVHGNAVEERESWSELQMVLG